MAEQSQTGKASDMPGAKDARAGKSNNGNKPNGGKSNESANDAAKEMAEQTDPIALLKTDHRKVEQLFTAFETASSMDQKVELAEEICTELMVHTLIEEEIFYPACEGRVDDQLLNEAQVEHDGTKRLLIEVKVHPLPDKYFDAKMKVLSELIKHHVNEEEKARDGILAKAIQAGIATADLAERLASRKAELMEDAKAGRLGPPQTRSYRVRFDTGTRRAGRFARDEDDRRYARMRDDDDRRYRRMRDDDDRRYARMRDDDDDDRRGGRGHGGWYGDPEGHAEAARRGWDEREGPSRSRYRDDDDDDRRGGRRHGGWYGDPEGHSEAARRRRD